MTESLINALITSTPPTLTVIIGIIAILKRQKTMMISIDGRVDELIKLTKTSSHAEGKEEERQEELARQKTN